MTIETGQTRSSGKVQVGDQAPDFTLSDQSGNEVHFSELLGKKSIVLYFYPKDETPGCTAEACAFRDNYEVFKDEGAEMVESVQILLRLINSLPQNIVCLSFY